MTEGEKMICGLCRYARTTNNDMDCHCALHGVSVDEDDDACEEFFDHRRRCSMTEKQKDGICSLKQGEELSIIRPDFASQVDAVLSEVRELLIEKNKGYGNSALEPVRIFSKADPVAQLEVRIDDKLSRLGKGQLSNNEDTVMDLMGYLVLLRIAKGTEEKSEDESISLSDASRRIWAIMNDQEMTSVSKKKDGDEIEIFTHPKFGKMTFYSTEPNVNVYRVLVKWLEDNGIDMDGYEPDARRDISEREQDDRRVLLFKTLEGETVVKDGVWDLVKKHNLSVVEKEDDHHGEEIEFQWGDQFLIISKNTCGYGANDCHQSLINWIGMGDVAK